MRFETSDFGYVTVTLSRRNLLTLLSKLDQRDSRRMITRRCEDGTQLYVRVEPDEEHYTEREPGPMSPESETFIATYEPGAP